jgi:hypothetical protein
MRTAHFAAAVAALVALPQVAWTQQQAPLMIRQGTTVEAMVQDSVSSRTNKIGDTVSAVIASDIRNVNDQVVVHAGSKAELVVVDLKPADRNEKNGIIRLDIASVESNGKTYHVKSQAGGDSVSYETKKPGWTSDKQKIGIGAAAGAVIGGLASGNLKGALIGGVLGAGVGAGVSHEMSGRDVIVTPGTKVTFQVSEPVSLTT